MWRLQIFLVVFCCASVAWAQPAVVLDADGETLPKGAVLRLGTTRLRHTNLVNGVTFNPKGTILASCGWDDVRLWDATTGKLIHILRGTERHGSFAAAFSPNGFEIASVGEQGIVRMFDVSTGKQRWFRKEHSDRTYAIVFRPDGSEFATAGSDNTIRIWDPVAGTETRTLELKGKVQDSIALAYSPYGKRLVAAVGGTIQIWDLDAGTAPLEIDANASEIATINFLPDGNSFITAGGSPLIPIVIDGKNFVTSRPQIQEWDSVTGKLIRTFDTDGFAGGAAAGSLSNDGLTLVTKHHDGIRVWDMKQAAVRRTIGDYVFNHGQRTQHIAITPDGTRVAVCGVDHAILMFDVESGRRILDDPQAHEDRVWSIAISKANWLASGAGDGVRIWDISDGKQLCAFRFGEGDIRGVHGLAFSEDDRQLAAAGYHSPSPNNLFEGLLIRWHTDDWTQRSMLRLNAQVRAVAFAPDGEHIAVSTGSADSFLEANAPKPAIYLYTTTDQTESQRLELDVSTIALLFASNETLIAVDERALVRCGTTTNGEESWSHQVPHPKKQLSSAAISPDCRWLATSGSYSETIILTDLTMQKEIHSLQLPGTLGSIVEFSPDSRLLVTAPVGIFGEKRYDPTIRVWDAQSARKLHEFAPGEPRVGAIAVSADGQHLITGMNDSTLLVWDLAPAYAALDK